MEYSISAEITINYADVVNRVFTAFTNIIDDELPDYLYSYLDETNALETFYYAMWKQFLKETLKSN